MHVIVCRVCAVLCRASLLPCVMQDRDSMHPDFISFWNRLFSKTSGVHAHNENLGLFFKYLVDFFLFPVDVSLGV